MRLGCHGEPREGFVIVAGCRYGLRKGNKNLRLVHIELLHVSRHLSCHPFHKSHFRLQIILLVSPRKILERNVMKKHKRKETLLCFHRVFRTRFGILPVQVLSISSALSFLGVLWTWSLGRCHEQQAASMHTRVPTRLRTKSFSERESDA